MEQNLNLPRTLLYDVCFPFSALVYVILCRPLLQRWFHNCRQVSSDLRDDIKSYQNQLKTGKGQPERAKSKLTRSWVKANGHEEALSIIKKVVSNSCLHEMLHSGLVECSCQDRGDPNVNPVMALTSMGSVNAAANDFLEDFLAPCTVCWRPRNFSSPPSFLFLSFPETAGTINFEDILVRGTTFNHVATLYRGHDERCWAEVLNSNPSWTHQWLRIEGNVVTGMEQRNELDSDGLCIAIFERRS